MSKITITDLEVFYCVGVPDEERSKPQRLLVTIEMDYDFMAAAVTDDIEKTIDYYRVTQRVLRFGDGRSWRLIEKLANDLAELVLGEFNAEAVTVTIEKFIIPEAAHVSVNLTKRRA